MAERSLSDFVQAYVSQRALCSEENGTLRFVKTISITSGVVIAGCILNSDQIPQPNRLPLASGALTVSFVVGHFSDLLAAVVRTGGRKFPESHTDDPAPFVDLVTREKLREQGIDFNTMLYDHSSERREKDLQKQMKLLS
jgi:hypothetical protein